MDEAIHQPLDIDFGFSPQSEPVQSLVNPNVGKNGLSNGQSFRVDSTSLLGVDFLYHWFGETIADGNCQMLPFTILAINASGLERPSLTIFFSSNILAIEVAMVENSFD
jgi:hypothetical protein